MSYNRQRKPPQPHRLASHRSKTLNNTIHIKAVDDRLNHLSDHILPRYPYLLSVPSDVPYQHSSRFINNWNRGTPFARDEESIQYLSFLPRQEEDCVLLKAEGGWADQEGGLLGPGELSRDPFVSEAERPPSSAQRKRITLLDYKHKSNSDVLSGEAVSKISATSKKTAAGGSPDRAKRRSSPAATHCVSSMTNSMSGTSSPRKRTHDGDTKPQRGLSRKEMSPPLDKPAHTYSPPKPTSPMKADGSSRLVGGEAPNLPRLVSPTLPASEDAPIVPQLLSPTLPPAIEDFLAKETDKFPTDTTTDHHRTESVRHILATAGLDPLLPSAKKSPGLKAEPFDQRNRSDSQLSTVSAASNGVPKIVNGVGGRLNSPVSKLQNGASSRPGTPKPSGMRSSPGPRQRHTISLKYGKKNRKRVEALLKFKSRSKESRVVLSSLTKPEQPIARSESRPEAPQHSKRQLDEASPEPAAKRQKPTPIMQHTSERANTPVPLGVRSPALQSSFQPKPNLTTPKKDLKSSAMRRVESADGGDARTPASGPTRQSTPMSIERTHTATRASPPTSMPISREDERQAWKDLAPRYFELGRTIKKEGTSFGPSPGGSEPSRKDSAMGVVLLIEAMVCFMINLAAVQLSHPGTDPGWRTILPYHIYVFRHSRKFPHLHGIVVQLGAICRQLIHKLDMERLARDPLPEEHASASAPTPGSDGNTKTSEDSDRYRKKYQQFRNDLIDNTKELQTAWLDGSRLLPLDTLRTDYHETWAHRSLGWERRGREKLIAGKLAGDYFLPLDASTSAIEACRFTMKFLEEWTMKEDLKWKPRVEL